MPSESPSRLPFVVVAAFAASLALAVFQYGGLDGSSWNVSLVLIALAAAVYWLASFRAGGELPYAEPWHWPLLFLLGLTILQVVPLPLPLVSVISRSRAELSLALRPLGFASHWTTLSVAPARTLDCLFRLVAYALVLFTLRDIAGRWSDRPWRLVFPLVAIAAAEAVFGLLRYGAAPTPAGATGTYVNRNHFAWLLELALSFPLMGVFLAKGLWGVRSLPFRITFTMTASICSVGAIVLAITLSLSRAGYISMLASGLVVVLATRATRLRRPTDQRSVAYTLLGAAALVLLLLLPPDLLLNRFNDLFTGQTITAAVRQGIWTDCARLIRDYALTGCGLGAFESCFFRYNTVHPSYPIAHAHNDYLQFACEWGLPGFLACLALLVCLIRKAARALRTEDRPLAIACLGALTAAVLHAASDYNFYVPANALAAAWIAAIILGLPEREADPAVVRVR